MKKHVIHFAALMIIGLSLIACHPAKTNRAIKPENEQLAEDIASWAMPLVSFFAQKEANVRDMGAQPNQVLYWSKPFDHNNKILTPNNTVLYISAQIETFDGPMVLEVPAKEGQLGIFGSLVDPFMVPLEDIGNETGIDQDKGGKILITPPNYSKDIPEGYLHVPSAHYNTVAGLRITPESFSNTDIAAAITFIKKIKLYPFGTDKETVFVDGGNKPYDPRPPYDENYFRLINHYIQTESHKDIDNAFIAQMSKVGIEKGEAFTADSSHIEIAQRVWEKYQAGMYQIGLPYFPDANWRTPVKPHEPANQFTYVDADGNYDWQSRAQTFHWAIWGPKHLGKATFYLMGNIDNNGQALASSETYQFVVPPNVPASKFWSVTMYEFETGGTFFDDVPKVAVTSKQENLIYNDDGSVTVTFGPQLPEGTPASNYVPTVGNGSWFVLFRWYGPQPELFPDFGEDRWVMGDIYKISE
ncbi:MAG: DUF1214 domain-containing protein [Bacteroidales bacterium]|nr:DUF1214 domain-containing protein [Bacteroidales bacterium]